MIRKPITRRTEIILHIMSVICMLLGYCAMSYKAHEPSWGGNPTNTTMPNMHQFVEGWERLLKNDWLGEDLKNTFLHRFSLGLIVGVAISFFVGMGMGVHPPIEAFCKLPIQLLGRIPPTAMLAVYFMLFGIELKMYVAMIALGIFPSLTLSIYMAATTDVTDHAIYKAYTLGADSYEVIRDVVVGQVLPRIVEFIRLSIGPAVVFLIAAEWSNADVGFGYRLRIQSRLMNMNVVYTYLAILGLIGFIFDIALLKLRNWLCPWFDKPKG